jgi:hypothetical protein
MSAFVMAIAYLPFMYIARKNHRFVWKQLNVWYTQLAFDCRAVVIGKVILTILDKFRDYVDVVMKLFPARFIARKMRDVIEE